MGIFISRIHLPHDAKLRPATRGVPIFQHFCNQPDRCIGQGDQVAAERLRAVNTFDGAIAIHGTQFAIQVQAGHLAQISAGHGLHLNH